MQSISVTSKKYLITKSNDNCVIAVLSEDKTSKSDFFINETTMKKNIDNKTFVRHNVLKYNDEPIYIYHEDI
jgi:hypothetical protein